MADNRMQLVVASAALQGAAEGTLVNARGSQRGDAVVVSTIEQLIDDGRGFMVSNTARETAEALAGTSFSDTAPAFLLDVPTGTTAKLAEITMNTGGTVAGGVITLLVTLSDKLRYSSGGTAKTPQNLSFDEPRTANSSFYTAVSAITAGANTDDITLEGALIDPDVATAPYGAPTKFHWSAKTSYSPQLVGPASVVVYSFAATTAPSWFYNFKWVEYPTT